MRRFRHVALLSLALGNHSALAAAGDGETELHWDPAWRRFGALDWTVTGVGLATALGAEWVGPDRDHAYREHNDFDEAVRDTLRAEGRDGRLRARRASDVTWALVASSPVVVDATLNAWLYRGSWDVAWELTWIDLEAASITAALTGVTKALVSRERPYGRHCDTPLADSDEECSERDRYYSFLSGHSSGTFSAATVSCVTGHYVPLWGTRAPYWRCVAGYGVAATTAVLRVAADRHYASDVIAGSLLGTGVGFVVPWLHFRGGGVSRAELERPSFAVWPTGWGVVVNGTF